METRVFVVLLLAALFANCFAATVFQMVREGEEGKLLRSRRGSDGGEGGEPECLLSTPCGWAVYTRYTRRHSYFMKNKCECPSHKKCIKTDDDLSVSAYVYRCKEAASDDNKVTS